MDKISIVFIGEMQRIQHSLTYAINQEENLSFQVFINNQVVLKVLKNPNKCSTLQIIQGIVCCLDILKA